LATFVIWRHLSAQGLHCEVVAPSSIPRAPGERIKADQRDAPLLAKLAGAGDLSVVRVPNGVDVTTDLAVVSEVGPDQFEFPSVKHFTSWLGLCPGTKISGGKILSAKTKRCVNRAAHALRLAAAALRSSKSALVR
jgi:transposase